MCGSQTVANNTCTTSTQIDQSSGKTAGLKHVTKDMKSKAKSSVVKSAKAPKPPAPCVQQHTRAFHDPMLAAKPLTLLVCYEQQEEEASGGEQA